MNPNTFSPIAQLSDPELIAQIEQLAQREREATATLIAYLGEMEARRLYLQEGCSSLFTYCTRVLRFSERAAYRRMEAAKIGLKFPIVLEMLSAGWINLTTITLLAPELTPANHRKLLETSKHKTRKQMEKIIAALRPRPAVSSTIRQLPSRTASLVFNPPAKTEPAGSSVTPPEMVLEIRPPTKPVVVPLSPRRFRIQFTATEETHDLLRRAQDLLRHQIPNGDAGEVIAKALKVLVRELEKEKIAETDRPRGSRVTAPRSRHIPAEVRRQVWKRDGGQCAFIAHNGRRCAERAFLEYHHVVEAADDQVRGRLPSASRLVSRRVPALLPRDPRTAGHGHSGLAGLRSKFCRAGRAAGSAVGCDYRVLVRRPAIYGNRMGIGSRPAGYR